MCSSFDPYHTDLYSVFGFSAREDFLEGKDVRVIFQSHYYFSPCLLVCSSQLLCPLLFGWLSMSLSLTQQMASELEWELCMLGLLMP